MKNSISIAIPTYDGDQTLDVCLKSLSKESFSKEYRDIIIVSNGPKTRSENILKKYEFPIATKHLHLDQASVSNARNAALKSSLSDMVLFFDNDMTFSGTTLAAYADAINQYGPDHFYGGPVSPDYESPPPLWLIDYLPRSAKEYSLGPANKEIAAPIFLGGNHAVPRRLTLENAMYDSDGSIGKSGLIGEETRVQENLLSKNITGIYVSGALSYHYVPIDRCTPEWVLHRNYRTGFTAGKRDVQGKCRLVGVPCWVIRRILSLYFQFFIGRIQRKDDHELFKTRYQLMYYLGIVNSKIKPEDLPDVHLIKAK